MGGAQMGNFQIVTTSSASKLLLIRDLLLQARPLSTDAESSRTRKVKTAGGDTKTRDNCATGRK